MRTLLFLAILCIASCTPEAKQLTAQQIIDAAMKASGTDLVANATITFDFRNRQYIAARNKGKFALSRTTIQEEVVTKDILSNNGFERYINDEFVILSDDMASRYAGSVNSVHYFSVLPYGLNDGAVQKKLLPEASIKNTPYYKVQISFSEDGGGEDFEDVFIYWVSKDTFKVEYLAYSYHVNGGGKRFREATNERLINGIRFVDYNNYKATNALTKLEALDKAFEKGSLDKLSEINLENIKVKL